MDAPLASGFVPQLVSQTPIYACGGCNHYIQKNKNSATAEVFCCEAFEEKRGDDDLRQVHRCPRSAAAAGAVCLARHVQIVNHIIIKMYDS